MSINKGLEELIQQQVGGFTLSLSNGFKIWVVKLGNHNYFTLGISDKKDNGVRTYKKVGVITDIDLFRRCFNG